jgi:UDP-N-acetylglucosamine 4-epimerase
MKIVVTGGAGFIGSNLVSFLLSEGHSVRVLDNFSTGKRENLEGLSGDLEVIEGGIEKASDCEGVCSDGVDCISHQAACCSVPRSIKNPELYSLVNLHGFVNMANAARRAGIKKFIYASSSAVYGNSTAMPKVESQTGMPLSPYAASKAANELFAYSFSQIYDMTFVGLRYFNIFGPRQDPEGPYAAVIPLFIKHLLKNRAPTIYGDGEQSRDFTFVRNVVQANYNAIQNNSLSGSKVYNIACGSSTSVNALFQQLSAICQADVAPVFADPRPGDIRDSLADISLAQKDLGYQPSVKMEEGLRLTVEWFRENGF